MPALVHSQSNEENKTGSTNKFTLMRNNTNINASETKANSLLQPQKPKIEMLGSNP